MLLDLNNFSLISIMSYNSENSIGEAPFQVFIFMFC